MAEVGQNVAEYAVLLALILVLMIGAVQIDRCKHDQRFFEDGGFDRASSRRGLMLNFSCDFRFVRHRRLWVL